MGSAKMVVARDKLSAETLLALFEEVGIPAEHGPEGMGNVQVEMGELRFLIDPYPAQGMIKVWTAHELDPDAVELAAANASANAFNQAFLLLRNFVFQDPQDPKNYRAIWDHDHLVGAGGLTAEDLLMVVSRVSDVLLQAITPQEPAGHA